jgi:alanine racemase
MTGHNRVWEEVDLDAIYQNVEAMQAAVTDVDGTAPKLCAVVKADGYGHGAVPIAKKIDGLVWGYAVATVDEAMQLRAADVNKPILILGFVDQRDYALCMDHQIRVTLYERAEADDMVQAVLKYREETGKEQAKLLVHIKLDTGMGRLGFLTATDALQEQSVHEIAQVCSLSELDAEGCFMHFSKADEADKTFSNLQHQRFMQMLERLKALGVTFEICHCDNSAGIIDLPGWHGDMVRMGIALYGLYPSDEVNKKRLVLAPAMSLKSRLVYVKTVPAGTPISYGGTYVTTRETRIGTIPVGYADGYPRSLSNKGRVLVCGKSVPIIGRVCMDQMMVDLTDVPEAEKLTEVTLIGRDGAACITVEEAVALAGTFNYEFICGISKRVPRVYLEGGIALENAPD